GPGQAAAVHPEHLRRPGRHGTGPREPGDDAHHRGSSLRARELSVLGAGRRPAPDVAADDGRGDGRQCPRRARGQPVPRQRPDGQVQCGAGPQDQANPGGAVSGSGQSRRSSRDARTEGQGRRRLRDGVMNQLNGYDVEALRVGMSASFSKTITEADLVLFAGVSGDNNAMHVNEEFAAATAFGGRIAHSLRTARVISAATANKLARPRASYLEPELRWLASVARGEPLHGA